MLDKVKRVSIYQPEQTGLKFPEIPVFDTPAQERRHRKERLVAACRAFALHGLDYGFAGHLTVRDPEHPHLYWTNPMAVHFSQVKLSNLILADHAGKVVEGDHAINRAGFVLHAAVHEAQPDIIAMCHAHTVYGVAFASLGKKLEPITQDAAVFFEDHVVITSEGGKVTVEEGAGTGIAAAFKGVKAAIHQNHGLITCSRHS
ncbi:MAG: class II aldolase/adducin family protein, partial [Thermomonas sp.]